MKYPTYRLMPSLLLMLLACGCSTLDDHSMTLSRDEAPGPTTPETTVDTPRGTYEELRRRSHLNVYGLSYHSNRDGIRERRLDNEFNFGLGLGYKFHESGSRVASIVAGLYKDSGRNWTRHAGFSYQVKLGERWRLGAAFLGIASRTYNGGETFIAPVPLLTYTAGAVNLNVIYAPRYMPYNEFGVMGMYLSIPFGR